jgi:unsaturated rhamnogalacturonyl hydrolase
MHILWFVLLVSPTIPLSAATARLEAAPASEAPWSPSEIAAVMEKVNDWQTSHPYMKPEDRNWVRATWFTGIMAAGLATGDGRYIKQGFDWGEQHRWQVGTERAGANVLTCTQTYLQLHFVRKDRTLIEPTIRWLASDRPNTPGGAIPVSPGGARVWYFAALHRVRYSDSLFVAAPALAMLAQATGEPKYLEWMHAFFWDVHQELFDEKAGLFYRDKRFIGAGSLNGRKVLWSRGNGWPFASVPRILTYLPEDDPLRARYVALFRQMAASLAARQQADGLWRSNLDDEAEFPRPETSGSGFFCYGFAWGIRHGLLDSSAYLPVVKKAWAGLVRSTSSEGKVLWGERIGDRPARVEQEDSHEYVTGAFLLAASEMYSLAKDGRFSEALASRPE